MGQRSGPYSLGWFVTVSLEFMGVGKRMISFLSLFAANTMLVDYVWRATGLLNKLKLALERNKQITFYNSYISA
jgi:hypothetical protein